jgi:hypothetical protein
MAAHAEVSVGYNMQVAVDAKHKLIVEQAVTKKRLPNRPASFSKSRRSMSAPIAAISKI